MDMLSIIIYAICGRMEKPMRKYENLNCISENRVPQRAYYIPQSGCTMLNGIWDFKFFDCDFEEAYIEKWLLDYGFGLDIINIALKKTTSKANPNFEYLDKLLTDWHDRSLKTSNEVQSFLTQMKEKNKNIKTLEKTAGYSNYDQRNYNDLNSFYTN